MYLMYMIDQYAHQLDVLKPNKNNILKTTYPMFCYILVIYT